MEYEYIYPIKYKIYFYYVPNKDELNEKLEEKTKEDIIIEGYEKYIKIKERYHEDNFETEYLNVYQNIEWIYEKIWKSNTTELIIWYNCYYDYIFEENNNMRKYIIENKYNISQNFDIILNKELKDNNIIGDWILCNSNLPKIAIIKKETFLKFLNKEYHNINVYYSKINIYDDKLNFHIQQYIMKPLIEILR